MNDKHQEFQNIKITVLLSPINPVRRVEWYKKYKPATYKYMVEQALLAVTEPMDDAAKRIANVEAIFEEFPNRLEAFHVILNEKATELA